MTITRQNLDLTLIHKDDVRIVLESFYLAELHAEELLRLDTSAKLASRPDSVAGGKTSVGTPIYLTDKEVRLLCDLIKSGSVLYPLTAEYMQHVFDGQGGFDEVFSGISSKLLKPSTQSILKANNLLREKPKGFGFFLYKNFLSFFYA